MTQSKKRIVYFSHGGGPLPLLGDPGHKAMIDFMRVLPEQIARPDLILVISAHWEETAPTLLGSPNPPIFYDYYGFPPETYTVNYPAPGAPESAQNIADILATAGIPSRIDPTRGYDHGHFIPLMMMYPEADIPTLQLSLIRGLDPASNDKLWSTEPFCSILSEVALPERDAPSFLRAATQFANNKLWGTLSCSIIIDPRTEAQGDAKAALDQAVDELRYGAVAINHWPGVVYGAMTPPWGGHISGTLKDVQSGIGFVHNTPMIEGIEKVVFRGPLTVFPKPPWFVVNRRAHHIGEKLVDFEHAPSLLKLPSIVMDAVRG